MKSVVIESPNGFMKDDKGRICLRFGGWEVGSHLVPDYVADIKYVADPAAHKQPLHPNYKTDQ